MNLFDKLKKNKTTPSLLEKKGRFVVDDTVGISLLTAYNYQENNGKFLLITSNLYKAQQLYSLISSFINNKDILLFPSLTDDMRKQLKFQSTNYSFFYTDKSDEYELHDEPVEAMSQIYYIRAANSFKVMVHHLTFFFNLFNF